MRNHRLKLVGKIFGRGSSYLLSIFLFFKIAGQFILFKYSGTQRFVTRWIDLKFCLFDATQTTRFDRHYVFHTAWASRVLAELRPESHVDVSSSLFFVTLVSAFVPVHFYDYRPARLGLAGLESSKGDLLSLPFADDSVNSISCMHVVEHVGLGRYGDPLDYDGDLTAIEELKRVVAPGGHILFVVPIGGSARIQFNAHRIYRYDQVLSYFQGFELKEFALIPDDEETGGLIRNAAPELASVQRYACGCFHFQKATHT